VQPADIAAKTLRRHQRPLDVGSLMLNASLISLTHTKSPRGVHIKNQQREIRLIIADTVKILKES
jgi:hypothetical protein